MIYRVIVTPNAEDDLRRAYGFIRRDSSAAAHRWIQGVRKTIKPLAQAPARCSLAPESALFDETIRELFYGRSSRGAYRILFAVAGERVYVLHVRHGSMDVLRKQI